MSSYSQYGEDAIVAAIFGRHVGRLLEIGAWEPIDKSNSRLFIELGWQAVLVDFSPSAVRKLVEQYGNSKTVKVLQAAITPVDSGLRPFQISDDGLSSNDAPTIAKWKEFAGYLGTLWVPQLPLPALLAQFGAGFDYVSIDAEGASIALAIALLQNCAERPRVLCVEHDGRSIELMQVAQPLGYTQRWINGTNMILSR